MLYMLVTSSFTFIKQTKLYHTEETITPNMSNWLLFFFFLSFFVFHKNKLGTNS